MTTTIKVPDLPAGLTLTINVINPTSLTTVETVTMTESSGIYSGDITGSFAGQYLFRLKASGNVIGSRLRTIAADAGPYVIVEGLERLGVQNGANLVTYTVNDGASPIENASVRMTTGNLSEVKLTNASGVVTFSLNSATYTRTISAPGYGSSVASAAISTTTTATISLTATSITPPADATVSTGVMRCYSELGAIEVGVDITLYLTAGNGTAGYARDTKPRTETSDVNGDVEFTGLIRGCTYTVYRGAAADEFSASGFVATAGATQVSFVVPNSDSFNIAEVIGLDVEV